MHKKHTGHVTQDSCCTDHTENNTSSQCNRTPDPDSDTTAQHGTRKHGGTWDPVHGLHAAVLFQTSSNLPDRPPLVHCGRMRGGVCLPSHSDTPQRPMHKKHTGHTDKRRLPAQTHTLRQYSTPRKRTPDPDSDTTTQHGTRKHGGTRVTAPTCLVQTCALLSAVSSSPPRSSVRCSLSVDVSVTHFGSTLFFFADAEW